MRRVATVFASVLLAGGGALGQDAVPAPDLDADGFLRAGPGYEWSFPRDHGSHPATRTEWWYLTGPLTAEDGREFGFQATWFRRALVPQAAAGRSPLAVRDVMLFHGALTDITAGRLLFSEDTCRAYPPWARAAEDGLDVALLGNTWSAPGGDLSRSRLVFGAGGARLALELDLASTPPLFHGAEPGLSVKGAGPGQASHYVSFPRVPVRGTLTLPEGEVLAVTGRAWFDHEFGSSQLAEDQAGWDWFSTALDDGSDLMLYQMRRRDGSADDTSAGTLRRPDGTVVHLAADDFVIEPTGEWTSTETGATYPSAWVLRVPGEDLELTVTPVMRAQELSTPGSTGVVYWEGLCSFDGTRGGEPVSGEGYVELVGYDERFTERL
jgi:predicted secreted hydrolase